MCTAAHERLGLVGLRFKVLPFDPMNDLKNTGARYAELIGQTGEAIAPRSVQSPNRSDLRLGKFPLVTILRSAICHVCFLVAGKKVIRIAARRIVALVKHSFHVWNGTMCDLKSHSVGFGSFTTASVRPDDAITPIVGFPSERPTFMPGFHLHLRPKPKSNPLVRRVSPLYELPSYSWLKGTPIQCWISKCHAVRYFGERSEASIS